MRPSVYERSVPRARRHVSQDGRTGRGRRSELTMDLQRFVADLHEHRDSLADQIAFL